MAFLYVNSKGNPWSKHSYSAGNDFDQSPYKYYLRRVLGWKEKDNKARFLFGKALEESIQFHHDHYGLDPVADFDKRWAAHKDKEVSYTSTEQNWETLRKMGSDIVRLYTVVQPTLPIPIGARTVWQREYAKQVFPGDPNYGGIEDAGKLDIVSYADWNHPLLEPISPSDTVYRPLIVDIKTSAVEFPDQPGMAAFDAQLRRYSWLSGIRDVALLWFVKKGLGYKKGYSITFLESVGNFIAGQEGVVAKIEDSGDLWVVTNDFLVAEMDKVQGKKGDRLDTTNEAKQRAMNFLEQHATKVSPDKVTKQRMQFNHGRVTDESADDAGRIAGRQIVNIVNAWKEKKWPNTFGIRYPKDDRNDSYFRAFVLNEPNYRDQNFVRSDEQAMDDLFLEDTQ
jgi:hypothetical protein